MSKYPWRFSVGKWDFLFILIEHTPKKTICRVLPLVQIPIVMIFFSLQKVALYTFDKAQLNVTFKDVGGNFISLPCNHKYVICKSKCPAWKCVCSAVLCLCKFVTLYTETCLISNPCLPLSYGTTVIPVTLYFKTPCMFPFILFLSLITAGFHPATYSRFLDNFLLR